MSQLFGWLLLGNIVVHVQQFPIIFYSKNSMAEDRWHCTFAQMRVKSYRATHNRIKLSIIEPKSNRNMILLTANQQHRAAVRLLPISPPEGLNRIVVFRTVSCSITFRGFHPFWMSHCSAHTHTALPTGEQIQSCHWPRIRFACHQKSCRWSSLGFHRNLGCQVFLTANQVQAAFKLLHPPVFVLS